MLLKIPLIKSPLFLARSNPKGRETEALQKERFHSLKKIIGGDKGFARISKVILKKTKLKKTGGI